MRKGRVFISYRRDDAAGYARAVYDELVRRFSDERVFMDVDDIAAGQAFDDVIRRTLRDSQLLLVLIGKRWLGEPPESATRLADPADFVRQEIEMALSQGLHLIPVLLDGARMPREDELPDTLRPLARRQAIEVGNTRFAFDMQRLVASVYAALGETPPAITAPAWRWKRMLLLASAGGLAAGLLVGVSYYLRPAPERPEVNGEWRAEVTYDWPGARYVERFVFMGDAGELHGTASFLQRPRGIVEGSVEAARVRFATRTLQVAGSEAPVEQVHRYRGTLQGDEIRFVMQSEGGVTEHGPIEFTARRSTP